MSGVLVVGGYGVFGRQVAAELVRLGVPVAIAGRDGGAARRAAADLGPLASGLALDVRDLAACRAALAGRAVAACCAGPFPGLGQALLDACLAEGAHYVDIASDREHVRDVLSRGSELADAGLCAVPGASSLPGLSCALALWLSEGPTLAGRPAPRQVLAGAPARARVTLFIGNDNRKGPAAVRSALAALGRPIETARGPVTGFGGPERVELPAPFGPRVVHDLDAPDHDLLPALLGEPELPVSVKVGFELRAVGAGLGLLSRLGPGRGDGLARALVRVASWLPRAGSSGGVVQVELGWAEGAGGRLALAADREGQRMAALPCALVAHRLTRGAPERPGALLPWEVLGIHELLQAVAARGFRLEGGWNP